MHTLTAESAQVIELEATGPLHLEYDEEWLAVMRSTAHLMSTSKIGPTLPSAWGGRAGWWEFLAG